MYTHGPSAEAVASNSSSRWAAVRGPASPTASGKVEGVVDSPGSASASRTRQQHPQEPQSFDSPPLTAHQYYSPATHTASPAENDLLPASTAASGVGVGLEPQHWSHQPQSKSATLMAAADADDMSAVSLGASTVQSHRSRGTVQSSDLYEFVGMSAPATASSFSQPPHAHPASKDLGASASALTLNSVASSSSVAPPKSNEAGHQQRGGSRGGSQSKGVVGREADRGTHRRGHTTVMDASGQPVEHKQDDARSQQTQSAPASAPLSAEERLRTLMHDMQRRKEGSDPHSSSSSPHTSVAPGTGTGPSPSLYDLATMHAPHVGAALSSSSSVRRPPAASNAPAVPTGGRSRGGGSSGYSGDGAARRYREEDQDDEDCDNNDPLAAFEMLQLQQEQEQQRQRQRQLGVGAVRARHDIVTSRSGAPTGSSGTRRQQYGAEQTDSAGVGGGGGSGGSSGPRPAWGSSGGSSRYASPRQQQQASSSSNLSVSSVGSGSAAGQGGVGSGSSSGSRIYRCAPHMYPYMQPCMQPNTHTHQCNHKCIHICNLRHLS